MGIRLEFSVKGELFDGRLERAIAAGFEDGLDDIAQYGVDAVRQRMHGEFRHETGNAAAHVQVERAFADRSVTNGNLVYGPWLEGVSERNRSTRFKGYATFRRTTAEVDAHAETLMEQAIERRIGSL